MISLFPVMPAWTAAFGILAALFAATASAQTHDQVVDSFFPQILVDKSVADHAAGGPRPFRTSGYVVGDLNGDGSVFIVAAYSNGFGGLVRVLQKAGTLFNLVYETNKEVMGGDFPEVELQDLDNDRRPEIIVSFTSGRGPRGNWVFKWTGTRLELISPFTTDEYGFFHTTLGEAHFIDLDGDGKLEIVNSTGTGPLAPDETEIVPVESYEVFQFDGRKYVLLAQDFYRHEFFVPHGENPGKQTATFRVENPAGVYSMSIVNGAPRGTNRVADATVRLNGKVVAGPTDMNRQVYVRLLETPVAANNILEVELNGRPGSFITVTFRR